MEIKKGSQTSRPPKAVRNAASQRSSGGGKSIRGSVFDGPEQTEEHSRSSTDVSTLTSSDSKELIKLHPADKSTKSVKVIEHDDSEDALCKLEEYFGGSSSSSGASQKSDITHESVTPTAFTTQLRPPIQVMDRAGGFDPDRIPASIFSKPTSMMDWSLASNESLFSIQIGKNSFSRDHSFMLDLGHSQEFSGSFPLDDLNQSGEMIKSHKLPKSEQVVEIFNEPVSKEEENPPHFGLGARVSEEPVANRHVKIKMEGFGNGKVFHDIQSKQKPPKSSCCSWPSCPKCACGSWPSCSRKACCWSDCSCKCLHCPTFTCCSWPDCSCNKLCCRDSGLKQISFSSGSSNPSSTWDCWKCKRPTWSLKTMFCCLASKS